MLYKTCIQEIQYKYNKIKENMVQEDNCQTENTTKESFTRRNNTENISPSKAERPRKK